MCHNPKASAIVRGPPAAAAAYAGAHNPLQSEKHSCIPEPELFSQMCHNPIASASPILRPALPDPLAAAYAHEQEDK